MKQPANALPRRRSPEPPRLLDRLSAASFVEGPVARRGADIVSETHFRSRVAGWTAALARAESRHVALFEPDGVEFAAALLGAWHAGRTVSLPGDALPATCRDLATTGVAFAGDFPPDWTPLRAPPDGDPTQAFEPLDAAFVGVIIYTSGSTGEPQRLPKKLSQLAEEAETLETEFGNDIGDATVVATVSHQHIYGLLFKILWPLTARRPFLAESLAYPEQVAAQLSAGPSVLASSPAHLKRLPDTIDWTPARRATRTIFSSGGPLSLDAVTSVERQLGRAPVEVYGSSETGGIAWRQRAGGVERDWSPLDGVTVRNDGDTLAIRSPHLADDEWLRVADRGVLHTDSSFTLTGRADTIVKIEGKRISLTALERRLMASPLVQEARVVPLHEDRDMLGAIIVPSEAGWAALRAEGADAVRHRLRAELADATERVALPRRWRWVDALPVNSQGKVTLAESARLFATTGAAMPVFHVLDRSDDHAVVELLVSHSLVYFDGHFPGTPVLAGVVQVEWAVALGRRVFGFTGGFRRMEAIKFNRLFQPGPPLQLQIDWNRERSMLAFYFSSDAGRHSSGRIFFAS